MVGQLVLMALFIIGWDMNIKATVDINKLRPDEIAMIQFDSREPANYWLASAEWNKYYCDKHGHKFLYFATKSIGHQWCEVDVLASPWCKVKTMVQANLNYPEIKLFIYMDSDAVLDRRFEHLSLNELMGTMQTKLAWDPEVKPIIFNQDGPCWWCKLIERVGYTMCLNAGTVVWYRHPISEMILKQWWESAMDPYDTNPIRRKFRVKWPWEQDRQMAIYNRSSQHIQVASQPQQGFMDKRAGVKDWCLSHLPESGCFISHYCANSFSKQTLMKLYAIPQSAGDEPNSNSPIRVIHLTP